MFRYSLLMSSKNTIILNLAIIFLLSGLVLSHKPIRANYISPEYLTNYRNELIISDASGEQIIFLNTKSKKLTRTIQVGGQPGRTSISPNGKYLYIPIAKSEGKLVIVDLNKGELLSEIKVGHTPVSLVVSDEIAYVVNKFSNDISVVDLNTKEELERISVIREPVGAILSTDGKYLLVANSLPRMRGSENQIAASISVIATETRQVEKEILLPSGSNGVKDICLSNDGKFAYISHVQGRYQLIPTQLERGWMNTSALSIISMEMREYYHMVLLDDIDKGAANPWGVTCSTDGEKILVSLAGTHELCIIDRLGMHEKLESVESGIFSNSVINGPGDVKYDFSFLSDLKKRVSTKGTGPRGVLEIKGKVYISEYFSGTLTSVDLNDRLLSAESISLGNQPENTKERKGEILFHDARLCFQMWQSCSSCHPDARTDALNWDLLNDGIGNPKNTKSLVLSHFTPPAMVTGIRPTAESAVRSGLKYILFATRPEEEADAIDAYLKSLKPVPSPYLIDGELKQSAARGEKLFIRAACADCHKGDYSTDMKKYNVGTGEGREKNTLFDTPSLNEAWRNAPYLYDGRALTLKEVITTFNSNDTHGKTSQLTDQEMDDLLEYLRSL